MEGNTDCEPCYSRVSFNVAENLSIIVHNNVYGSSPVVFFTYSANLSPRSAGVFSFIRVTERLLHTSSSALQTSHYLYITYGQPGRSTVTPLPLDSSRAKEYAWCEGSWSSASVNTVGRCQS
ncbi:hypothetical protein E1B28_010846 [Marasmius oreades]|uniref:Uncharacterized protein n=1 Tax=Marasmius oreades TaxID=181124 RepID=A0A9P7RTI6_9AGAR|nr:uncharacterized protein E1B28_010846 [Marasmius oreades]KAG7089138.1 hypothetical protein E1B28_010846 [Marasmius oreades]